MTVWHWVRHGPTHAKSFVGWRDVPADLSDHGQIERVRQVLPKQGVVVSSDLGRARDTATAIAGKDHIRLAHNPHLREMHFGAWDGVQFEVVAERDPELSRAFWEEPGTVMAPGGESWDIASARVAAAVRSISARHPDQHIIAVAHFGVILTQLQRALGISAYETLSHQIDNFSVTTIDWTGAHPSVDRINHLP